MRLKKNSFGYVNFSIGTLIMSVYLYTLFVSLIRHFEEQAGKRILVLNFKLSSIAGFLLVVATALLVWLLFVIKSKITVKKIGITGIVSGLLYWFSCALLMSYGFFVRVTNLDVLKKWDTIQHYTESVSKPGYWPNLLNLYYGREATFDNFFHKAYTYVAALLLRIFGDKLSVPAFLNILLYVLASVFLFFAVRFIFGKIPALAALGMLMLSETTVTLIYDISGFNMFFFALSLLFFLVAYFLDVYTATKPAMCYVVSAVTVIAGIVINHLWFKPFEPVIFFDINILRYRPSENLYICIVIAIFAFIGYLSFLKNEEDEISFANCLFVVLLLILMFDYSYNNTSLFLTVTLCILAGIGADNLLFKNYKAEPASEIDLLIPEEDAPLPIGAMEVSDDDMIPEEVAVSFEEEPESTGVITVSNLVGEAVAKEPAVTDIEKPSEEPIEEPKEHVVPASFETPLPMPKKHVKKTFEYAFEPSSDLMKYDIDISADDDFDIK